MSIFGELFDIVKDVVTLPGQIVEAAVETATDISEVIVTDVQNKLSGKGNQEIKTSYDVKDEAAKIIEASNGEFWEAKSGLDEQYQMLQIKAKNTGKVRNEVYGILGYISKAAKVGLPNNGEIMPVMPSCPNIDQLQFKIGTVMGNAGISVRMEAAQDYLANANEYKNEVRLKILDINTIKRRVNAASAALEEEMSMLEGIREACKLASKAKAHQTMEIMYQIATECANIVDENTYRHYVQLTEHLRGLW